MMRNQDYYGHVRKEILPLLPEKTDRIFEVGCGSGGTLSYLKDSGRCAWAGGVELFHEAAESARTKKLDLVIEGSVSSIQLPMPLKSLDVILCLDVLEHLEDPWRVLRSLGEYLKPGGIVICSLPNVRNFRVTFPLLFKGKWIYENDGILDQSHLRFFTKESAISLVISSGFHVEAVSSTGLERWNKAWIANLFTLGLFKPFFEFQYLVRGVRK